MRPTAMLLLAFLEPARLGQEGDPASPAPTESRLVATGAKLRAVAQGCRFTDWPAADAGDRLLG